MSYQSRVLYDTEYVKGLRSQTRNRSVGTGNVRDRNTAKQTTRIIGNGSKAPIQAAKLTGSFRPQPVMRGHGRICRIAVRRSSLRFQLRSAKAPRQSAGTLLSGTARLTCPGFSDHS